MWQSSNPALNNNDAFKQFYGHLEGTQTRADVCTLQGVANKTALLVAIAVLAGAGGYALVQSVGSAPVMWISCITAAIVTFGVYLAISGNPARAKVLAPVYAIVEGAFLGALSSSLDAALVSMGYAVAGGVATQAFIITLSIALAMLVLYKAKLLRPTKTFAAVLSTVTLGIGIVYLISFVMMLFGVQLPFVSLGSALQGGTPALIGLGINVLILGIASLWLIIDFKTVEDHIAAGARRDLEWYCSFALLVTLAWIYYEAVKLVFRLAVLLGNRD